MLPWFLRTLNFFVCVIRRSGNTRTCLGKPFFCKRLVIPEIFIAHCPFLSNIPLLGWKTCTTQMANTNTLDAAETVVWEQFKKAATSVPHQALLLMKISVTSHFRAQIHLQLYIQKLPVLMSPKVVPMRRIAYIISWKGHSNKCLLGARESHGPAAQHICNIVQSSLYSWIM